MDVAFRASPESDRKGEKDDKEEGEDLNKRCEVLEPGEPLVG